MGDYNRKESYIGNDTSPVLVDTLASNLDVSTFDIVSSSNRNIDLTPNGTGVVNVSSNMVIGTDVGSYNVSDFDLFVSNADQGTTVCLYDDSGAYNSALIKYDTNVLSLGLNNANSANTILTTSAINVTSSGVGINTTSPETNLHINGNAAFKSGSNYTAYFAGGGAATLYHNGTQCLQTATSGNVNISGSLTSSGNFTIDAAGTITLDADTQGEGNGIHLKDGGIHYGSIYRSASDLRIKSEASDEDLIFLGNDGGSEITAMLIDMSEGGKVGIGSSAPEYKLHIEGSNVSSGGGLATMCVNDTGTAYNGTNPGGGITFRGKHNSSGSTTNFATVQGIKENTSDGNYASAIRLLTRANGGNLSEKLRIGSSGEIGLSGTNFGTSGQVLTSGGSGAAPSWTTISGGGGGGGGGSGGGIANDTTQSSNNSNDDMSQISNDMDDEIPF